MPATVVCSFQSVVLTHKVVVTERVNARNGIAATLAEDEVEHLPARAVPELFSSDVEWSGCYTGGFYSIVARLAEFCEINYAETAYACGLSSHLTFESLVARGNIHYCEGSALGECGE